MAGKINIILLLCLFATFACQERADEQSKEEDLYPYMDMDTVTITMVGTFDSTEMLYPGHHIIELTNKENSYDLDQYLTAIQSKLTIKDTLKSVYSAGAVEWPIQPFRHNL
ncbi:hypothetical protein [Pontibacter beigongshangensis]|uniref:hypothetical protein n=1 Tax=Pontibacter beigongshangensis TaxID=2574733 RepID=UPI00164FE4D2|nr:hypothetical protein [Pontibacter beigongshangensis]